MRINKLLIHHATLVIPGGEEVGKDAYNRPILSKPTTKQIKCRLDEIRQRTSTDEEGTDVVLSYTLYASPLEKIDIGMKITNVLDENDRVVADGTFNVEDVHPAYNRTSLHHYEIALSRGDVNYG
ncbi:putative minor capsid protein [Lysinibacillus fusiformis]|uniref:putative minor capsid protein n=1 Tax=Lysinibacillus fusiformis TaxID=28031 RepID=UPI003D01BD0C